MIKVWAVDTRQCQRTITGHSQRIWSIAFSPDGRTLATDNSDFTVRRWNVAIGECMRILKGHTAYVLAVAISPDGELVASDSSDATVRLSSEL